MLIAQFERIGRKAGKVFEMPATINKISLSFRNVLHTRERIGHIDRMLELTRTLGYPYFVWNDRVYAVGKTAYTDTGLTISDVL